MLIIKNRSVARGRLRDPRFYVHHTRVCELRAFAAAAFKATTQGWPFKIVTLLFRTGARSFEDHLA